MDSLEKIEALLQEQIQPMLASHGGGARLVSYTDGVVQLELLGACCGCPSADLVTRAAIEDLLRAAVPGVKGVELVQTVDEELLAFAQKLLGRPLI